jgi:glycosyltransferase involved in cell wall biosynthesis
VEHTAQRGGGASSDRPRIRILALVEGTTVVSGVSKNLFGFCRAVRALEAGPFFEVVIATFQRPARSTPGSPGGMEQFLEKAAQSSVPVHCIPEGFPFDARVLGHLREIVRRVQPDLIQTHAPKSAFLTRMSGLCRTVPWIAFHHGYTATLRRSPVYNYLNRWSLGAAAKIVTVSHAFEKQLCDQGARMELITVLHNAVEVPRGDSRLSPDARSQKKRDLGLSPDEKVILSVGRLSKEKGQIDLVAALGELKQIRPDLPARVMLVGDGPDQPKILMAAESAGLTNALTFVGHVADVSPYYQAADVVVIPSLSEGSPNVLLEAMAWGVPVVATLVGGIPEMVQHGKDALLVSPREPVAMASAIDLVLSSPGLAASLARHASATVEETYTPERRARCLSMIYEDVYRSALARKLSSAAAAKSPSGA